MPTQLDHPQTDLTKLSPFELKDKLIEMADESTKTRASVMLNAGRGNPNWIATTPREAFALMLTFGLSEARRSRNEPDVGLAGMPKSPGIAKRFEEFLNASGNRPARCCCADRCTTACRSSASIPTSSSGS